MAKRKRRLWLYYDADVSSTINELIENNELSTLLNLFLGAIKEDRERFVSLLLNGKGDLFKKRSRLIHALNLYEEQEPQMSFDDFFDFYNRLPDDAFVSERERELYRENEALKEKIEQLEDELTLAQERYDEEDDDYRASEPTKESREKEQEEEQSDRQENVEEKEEVVTEKETSDNTVGLQNQLQDENDKTEENTVNNEFSEFTKQTDELQNNTQKEEETTDNKTVEETENQQDNLSDAQEEKQEQKNEPTVNKEVTEMLANFGLL